MLLINQIILGISLFLGSIYLVRKFITLASSFDLIDYPNQRSSHFSSIPRGAGIVIVFLSELLVIFLCFLKNVDFVICLIVTCAFVVGIVGFLDDLFKLSIRTRLLVQCIASLIVVSLISSVDVFTFNSVLVFILLICINIWSTNLFNFMDGTDGLAAVEAIFVLINGGLLLISHSLFLGSILLLIASIVAGFLYFNLPPAKVFMGDVGSYFLGFLISSVAMTSYYFYKIPLLFWLIIYSVFCFDSTITLIRRIIANEKWYLAHRSHAYQRLQNIGWTHENILYGLVILNGCLTLIAFIGYYLKGLFLASMMVFILLSIIYIYIEICERRYANKI